MATSVDQFKKANPRWGASFDRLAWLKEQQGKQQNTPVQKTKRGSGNQSWLSSLISEFGAGGGAAGGAAAGAGIGSVVPGVGTVVGGLVGAGLGGFLGGTGGRLIENKVRDDRNPFEDDSLGDALREGALAGTLSALIPGGKIAASGGRALMTGGGKAGAAQAMKASGMKSFGNAATGRIGQAGAKLTQGTTGTFDDTLRGGLQQSGDKLRAFPRGIKPGTKLNLNKTVSTKQAEEINAAINKATKGKMASWSPTKQFTAVEQRLQSLYDDFAKGAEPGKLVNNTDDITRKVTENINKNVALRGNLTKANQRVLDNILEDIKNLKGKSAREVFDLAENLNKQASNIVEKGNIGSKEVKIYEAARQALKNHIDDVFPKKSALNKEVSTLQQAKNLLSKAVEADVKSTGAQGYTLGVMAKKAVTPAVDVLGRGVQTAGAAVNPSAKFALGANMLRQAPGNYMEAVNTPSGESYQAPTEQEQQNQATIDEINAIQASMVNQGGLGQVLGGDMPTAGDIGGAGQMQPDQGGMFSPANLQANVQQILAQGGDFDDVKKYLSIVEVMQELGGGGQGNLSADERKAQAKATQLTESVGALVDMFNAAGGGQGTSGLATSLIGRTPGLRSTGMADEAAIFEDTRKALIAPLARAISGEVGVLTDRDIKRAEGLLPRLTDTKEVADQKIQNLMYQIQVSSGTSPTQSDLSNALLQQLNGGQ